MYSADLIEIERILSKINRFMYREKSFNYLNTKSDFLVANYMKLEILGGHCSIFFLVEKFYKKNRRPIEKKTVQFTEQRFSTNPISIFRCNSDINNRRDLKVWYIHDSAWTLSLLYSYFYLFRCTSFIYTQKVQQYGIVVHSKFSLDYFYYQ